ncbi:MAG: hypothetical protein M3T96_08660 [Acidobacteriota bacterium]|nr:hypothetical protein [Acidobacteriota bacterium]
MENAKENNEILVTVKFSADAWKSPCDLIFDGSSVLNISKSGEIVEQKFNVITDKEIDVLLKCHHTDIPEIPTPKEHSGVLDFPQKPIFFKKGNSYLVYINDMNIVEISELLSTDEENI